MAIGLGALAIAPDTLWAMTPRELDAALRGRFGTSSTSEALTRGELSRLMPQFPDGDDVT